MIKEENIRVKITLNRNKYNEIKNYCSSVKVQPAHYMQQCVMQDLQEKTNTILNLGKLDIQNLNTDISKKLAKYVNR
jgi:hypothetical protein